MNHYYFKFGGANRFLKQCINERNAALSKKDSLPLAIYFGDWKVEDYLKGRTVNDGKDRDQIDPFFHAAQTDRANSVFWLFDDLIYALVPQTAVYNGGMKDAEFPCPKAVDSTVVKIFEKAQLPEAFASINSFQKYNRKTIVKLENEEAEVAEWLFTESGHKAKMHITKERRLFFLSPLQFETLVFLIFHHHRIFCSTYRGGTLKDVDLNIRGRNQVSVAGVCFHDNAAIQVKKCDYLSGRPRLRLANGVSLVHLGDSFPERRVYGKAWVEASLTPLSAVDNWLNESLDFFETS
ncbi:MAG: hypothetical protein ABSF91_10305 [Bacteroidota bacterium]|jgi:hypothetical protein